MGIFMDAQSMCDNSAEHDGSVDLQLYSHSPCIGYSKEGLHLRIAYQFMRCLCFKAIATCKRLYC